MRKLINQVVHKREIKASEIEIESNDAKDLEKTEKYGEKREGPSQQSKFGSVSRKAKEATTKSNSDSST